MKIRSLIFGLSLGLASLGARAEDHGDASPSDNEVKATAINPRCVVGDGKGCALCRKVHLPEKAPLGTDITSSTNCSGSSPFCGDDGKVYTYTVHYTGVGSMNGRSFIEVPNMVDADGNRVCPEGHAYRVFQKTR